MARASTPTLLSLDYWAKIMGVTPIHFGQAVTSSLTPQIFPLIGTCQDVWYQYAWQNPDQVSREDLARAIYDAEQDISRQLGYLPGPQWIANEMHKYPRHYNRQVYGNGSNVRAQFKSLKAKHGKFILAGRRGTTLISNETVAYTDPDGDGFSELATITATTTLTDECEIKLYFAGKAAAQEWEIRPVKTKVIAAGVVTFTVDSWLLIDPDLWETFPTSTTENPKVDISGTGNFETTVDVYREFTDITTNSAQFFWERQPPTSGLDGVICGACGGVGCEACSLITQDGCIHVRDVDAGLVVPAAADYDSTNAIWNRVAWAECREPDQVKIWYYAGELDERFLRDETCQPLSDYWAHAIAWLATARLDRNFCNCGVQTDFMETLREDMLITSSGNTSRTVLLDIVSNPFGSRRGEVMAWQRVSKSNEQIFTGVAV